MTSTEIGRATESAGPETDSGGRADLSALDPATLRALADLVEQAKRMKDEAQGDGQEQPGTPGFFRRVGRAGAAGAGAVAGALGGAVGAVGHGVAHAAQELKARADKLLVGTYEKALLCRFTLSMYEQLSLLAKRENVSMNALVNEALRDLMIKRRYGLPAPKD